MSSIYFKKKGKQSSCSEDLSAETAQKPLRLDVMESRIKWTLRETVLEQDAWGSSGISIMEGLEVQVRDKSAFRAQKENMALGPFRFWEDRQKDPLQGIQNRTKSGWLLESTQFHV